VARKRVYIVPTDSALRAELARKMVVIYTVRLNDGTEVDVCDAAYAQNDEIANILDRYCEYAEVDTLE